MTRPARRRLSACLIAVAATVLPLGAGGLATVPADAATTPATAGVTTGRAHAAATTKSPLRVSIETLSPAVVPTRGRVTITGRITNRSDERWSSLKAYMFTSSSPITDRAGLAEAAATDEAEAVGSRITNPDEYDEVDDLDPGESTSYRVSVPRRDLGIGTAGGVYWIGVHVLGESPTGGSDGLADGRARTFIPLVPRRTPQTRLALVVPFKAVVRRGAAGRLLGLQGWQGAVGADGRLDRLLRLSSRAEAPLTWVVDPAVLDAAQSVAADNPKLDPGPDGSGTDAGSGAPTTTPSPTASPSEAGKGGDVGSSSEPSDEATAARRWLDEFRRQAPQHTVTTVPYGDLDVAAVLGSRLDDLYEKARGLSSDTMAANGVPEATGVVDPLSGHLPGSALRTVDQATPIILSDSALPEARSAVVTRPGRAPLVLTDTLAGSGGPKPTARYAALAVRQRLLAAAALHALSAEADQPLVVSTPPYWDPGAAWASSDFFSSLDKPWLRMVDLPGLIASTPDDTASADPGAQTPFYPRSDRRRQLPLGNLLATRRLASTGTTFARLLTQNDDVEGVLARIGMLGSSQTARDDADQVLDQVNSTTDYVRSQMQQVSIEGPSFVMMSGEQGPIQVTVVNGLDEPVEVGIRASTRSSGLTIKKHKDITLGPGRRTAVRLEAVSSDIGVHAVTLVATDSEGTPLGTVTQLSVRTSRVSTVIWVIMAAGAVVLFIAIVVRLIRRVRRRKSTHGPRLPDDHRAGLPGQELNA